MEPHRFDRIESVWSAIERLKLILLYSHAIAIDDPGALLLDMSHVGDRPSFISNKAIFVNYLQFIVAIKPLQDAGPIMLLPKKATRQSTPTSYKESYGPEKYDLSGFDFTTVKALYTSETGNSFNMAIEPVLRVAESRLWSTARVSTAHQGALDYYMPHAYWCDVLKAMLKATHQQMTRRQTRAPELMKLQRLIDINIPDLDGMSCKDLIRIRSSEPAFQTWRIALGNALSKINAMDIDTIESDGAPLATLREEMCEAKVSLEQQIAGSKVLTNAVRGVKKFAVGGVATGATSSMVQEWEATLATATLTPFAELLIERKKQNPGQSILNYYFSVQ